MARIRTIKPEFFTSEDIVSLTPLARLLYIALWCESDREGRLYWKPKTFKMRYLPADDCDAVKLARELVSAGLVKLYDDGLAYIPSFSKHQHVNPRESASKLPEPSEMPRDSDASSRVPDAQVGREGKGKEGNEEKLSPPALQSIHMKVTETAPTGSRPEQTKKVTIEAITAYNSILAVPHGMLAPAKMSVGIETKRIWISRCLKAAGEICLDLYGDSTVTARFWEDYFAECDKDPFYSGRSQPGKGHENWKPDFEFLVKSKTIVTVYEKAALKDQAA